MENIKQSQEQKKAKPSRFLSFIIFIGGLICIHSLLSIGSLFLVAVIMTKKTKEWNLFIFDERSIETEKDKINLLKTMLLYLACFLFSLTSLTMFTRIITVSPNPAKGKDNLLINTFNRIIGNTIEQSVIFFGFFVSVLYGGSDFAGEIGNEKLLALAGLFFYGRIAFAIGYFLVSLTGIPTWRSHGFGINMFTNVILLSFLLNHSILEEFISVAGPLVAMVPLWS